ncbi:response regulator [bacterium]|nr:response regulator [bacterium]
MPESIRIPQTTPAMIGLKQHRIQFVSYKFEQWFGYSLADIKDKYLWSLTTENDIRTIESFARKFSKSDKQDDLIEISMISSSFQTVIMEANFIKPGWKNKEDYLVTFRNIHDEIIKTRVLLNTLKLEAIGGLASGVAHEFNNILMGIMGYLSLVKLRIEINDPIQRTLDKAEKSCIQGRNLTQELLSYSQPSLLDHQVRDIGILMNQLVTETVDNEKYLIKYEIRENLWPVSIDVKNISRAIVNLLKNAIQAMPDGGSLLISVVNKSNPWTIGDLLPQGKFLEITIKDNGIGIPRHIIDNVINPYFSTQPKSRGLGLTTAFFLIRHHGGILTVDQNQDVGSICKILLPAASEQTQQTTSRRILVIDDEPVVLETFCEMLETLGYSAIGRKNSSSAKNVFQDSLKKDMSFDLIVVDLSVLVNNPNLIKELRNMQPTIKAVITSGYTNDQITRNPRDHGFQAFLSKPVDLKTMEITLAEVFRHQEVK